MSIPQTSRTKARYDRYEVERILAGVDIHSLISVHVSLKKVGRVLQGLCPFHTESTPSFTVYPDTKSFFCFGCNVGGDAITFVRRVHGLSFREALEHLGGGRG